MTVREEELEIEVHRLRAWLTAICSGACEGMSALELESMAYDSLRTPMLKLKTCPTQIARMGLWPHQFDYI